MRKILERVIVRPPAGMLCRRPASEGGAMLPAEGGLVPLNGYWNRRLAAGDVELVPIEAPKSEPKPAPKKSKFSEE